MSSSNQALDRLPRYQQRSFVPDEADLTDVSQIKELYQTLIKRNVATVDAFEQWILDRSELEAALDERGTILYIRMTCQTDDPQRAQQYKDFIEHVIPQTKPLDDKLNKMFIKLDQQYPLDRNRYGIYTREIKTDLELFVEKNIPIETEIDLLSQDYQSICGAMTVMFDGREHTLPEMSKYLLESDRDLRENAWRASSERRLQDEEKLDSLFDEMLKRRDQIARNAGFDNYCDYKFKSLHRFDYTPEDCRKYHAGIEALVVPLWTRILNDRKQQMKLDVLRPWDTSCDPAGLPPLEPFKEVDDLIKGCGTVFNNLDPELGGQFDLMVQSGLLDLASRKGKAPGGYQSTLDEARKPFIFMNAVGTDDDVRTLLHEGGHAFHSMACAHDPLIDYRHGPMEFNEVASMGMELLADQYLDVFYKQRDLQRSCAEHLEDIIFTLTWVAAIDCFQQWIYDNPKHSRNERRQQWLSIHKRFCSDVIDWSGLENDRAAVWHKQLHIFEVPFYYIEYGIAQLGALQLWIKHREDPKQALKQYRDALHLGGARPLPELYATAGLKFDFSNGTIAPLISAVEHELDRYAKK